MSELRKDPIVDRWVLIAESRSQRPGAFLDKSTASPACTGPLKAAGGCPFCAGNEPRTPPAVYEQPDREGSWRVRIVPNQYPAVSVAATGIRGQANCVPAVGLHEVVIESPVHAKSWAQLSLEQVTCVLRAWRDRLAEHRQDGRWRLAFLFKNVGRESGASLDHVHSQILALPREPELIHRELQGAATLYRRHGRCAFCRLIEDERQAALRVVLEVPSFQATTAYAGRQPYETWVLPTEHQAAYDELADAQLAPLASVLTRILEALRRILPINAYNVVLNTAPFDTEWADRYHWHFEIIPRISGLAGFELGSGEFINPISPERAAREIKRNLAPSGII